MTPTLRGAPFAIALAVLGAAHAQDATPPAGVEPLPVDLLVDP